jgi:acetyl-CoA acetyltransferase
MSQRSLFRNKVAIVGAAVTNCVRHADMAVGSLAVQASDAAIADAGLTRGDIDGVACGAGLPSYARAPGYCGRADQVLERRLHEDLAVSLGSGPPGLAIQVVGDTAAVGARAPTARSRRR